MDNRKQILQTIQELSSPESYNLVYHKSNGDVPMPSVNALAKIVETIQEIIFPGYFGRDVVCADTIEFYTGVNVDKLFAMLSQQIQRGLMFDCNECKDLTKEESAKIAENIAVAFIKRLPYIRHMLSLDIQAAYNGDPAAKSFGEIIFCYPVIKTLLHYRTAHELLLLNVPLIPRIITEMAHSATGIDIHPAAQIGEYFTIDHGTGVVIGATCIIGNHVQLYQGVTLGAKNFPLDENGNPIKGIPRHPIVEDDVIIYSNATLLGRITIGKGAVIGANVWVTHDVEPNTKVLERKL
ncbi:MAG: serine acetyltransferase [Bacteroidales bacterium]|nr:serine acetyltransferase [Bacteroidales bacterium]